MTAHREVERKFLVIDPSVIRSTVGVAIEQAYLFGDGHTVIRVGHRHDGWRLGVREAGPAVSRMEFRTVVPDELGRSLFESSMARLSRKRRHFVEHHGQRWSVDDYHPAHPELLVAEVELPRPDASFDLPPWCGVEVTGIRTYYDDALALPRCEPEEDSRG